MVTLNSLFHSGAKSAKGIIMSTKMVGVIVLRDGAEVKDFGIVEHNTLEEAQTYAENNVGALDYNEIFWFIPLSPKSCRVCKNSKCASLGGDVALVCTKTGVNLVNTARGSLQVMSQQDRKLSTIALNCPNFERDVI